MLSGILISAQSQNSQGTEKQAPAAASYTLNSQQDVTLVASKSTEIQKVYHAYFVMKEALVSSDPKAVQKSAHDFLVAASAVDMAALASNEHTAWMKAFSQLTAEAKTIAAVSDINKQRKSFASLSASLAELMKTIAPQQEVYLQHCPMFNNGKGADWMSLQAKIRNPYYGNQMLSCGTTVGTIK